MRGGLSIPLIVRRLEVQIKELEEDIKRYGKIKDKTLNDMGICAVLKKAVKRREEGIKYLMNTYPPPNETIRALGKKFGFDYYQFRSR